MCTLPKDPIGTEPLPVGDYDSRHVEIRLRLLAAQGNHHERRLRNLERFAWGGLCWFLLELAQGIANMF